MRYPSGPILQLLQHIKSRSLFFLSVAKGIYMHEIIGCEVLHEYNCNAQEQAEHRFKSRLVPPLTFTAKRFVFRDLVHCEQHQQHSSKKMAWSASKVLYTSCAVVNQCSCRTEGHRYKAVQRSGRSAAAPSNKTVASHAFGRFQGCCGFQQTNLWALFYLRSSPEEK